MSCIYFRSYLLYPNFIYFYPDILVPFVHIIVQKSIYFSTPSINLAFFMKKNKIITLKALRFIQTKHACVLQAK